MSLIANTTARRARFGIAAPKLDKAQDSELEATFDYYYRALASNYPEPVKQFRFGRYMLDRSWPELQVSVELHGGAGGGFGRPIECHRCGAKVRARRGDGGLGRELRLPYPSHSGQGAERDAVKSNMLQAAGWVALQFTSKQISSDPQACIQLIVVELRKAQQRLGPKAGASGQAASTLTRREVDILKLVCSGLTYNQIGAELGIEASTVVKHTGSIRRKLQASSLPAACTRAVGLGLIDVSSLEFAQDNITDN